MYTLKYLVTEAGRNSTEINGKYVPARPLAPSGLWGLKIRIKEAWAVFTGKADAFTWPEGQ